MPLTDTDIAEWFRAACEDESHTAPWRQAIEELSAAQALWKPDALPVKHCIWDLVRHMAFWRELHLRELAGEKRTSDEVARRSWEAIEDVSEDAWRADVERFERSQAQMIGAIGESPQKATRLAYFIEHDAYHFGQIMLLRAMQGLPPVDSY